MAHQATPSSQKALMMELKSLQEQPVEGFRITLVEESDLYNWEVAIFGPPNTLYEGGYFKVGTKKLSNGKRAGNYEFRVAKSLCLYTFMFSSRRLCIWCSCDPGQVFFLSRKFQQLGEQSPSSLTASLSFRNCNSSMTLVTPTGLRNFQF